MSEQPQDMHPISTKKRIRSEVHSYPLSPAFVHNYSHAKAPKLTTMTDFCNKSNIPFCAEEDNFFKVNQNKIKFKKYKNTINDLFETGKPSEFEVGLSMLEE